MDDVEAEPLSEYLRDGEASMARKMGHLALKLFLLSTGSALRRREIPLGSATS